MTFVDPNRPAEWQVPEAFGEDVAARHGIMLRALERVAMHLQYYEGRDVRGTYDLDVYGPVEDDLRLALEALRPITGKYRP